MRLVAVLEQRFNSTPDGVIWTMGPYAYSFWTRYLDVFSSVCVVARVRQVGSVSEDWKRADGEGVSYAAVPHYLGPWQYLLRARQVKGAVRGAVGPTDAVILRVGSQLAAVMEPTLRRMGHPYGVEVVGDPYAVFAPGSVKHPLRPFFRWWFPRQLRRQCARACATAYVTEAALQRRYPSSPGAFSTHYSSIELPEPAFARLSRPARHDARASTLITVGTLAQIYKAPDVLIDAVCRLVRAGLDLRLEIIGDGKERPGLEARVRALGLGPRIRFLGQLPAGEAVRAELDRADLFVLPSRTEGLPRAMIEAMARALPCIGSTVGGIPELLPPEDLVPPGDAGALARKIREVLGDPGRMSRMSARNLDKARQYGDDLLRERRVAFYRHIKACTQAWLAGEPSATYPRGESRAPHPAHQRAGLKRA
ncbi:MAG: glycosyltransferase [Planctomycetaceae bacterium]